MFKTPVPLLEVQQLLSCSRILDDDRQLSRGEYPMTVRGRRRIEGRRESEFFETHYVVDIEKLKSVRKSNGR